MKQKEIKYIGFYENPLGCSKRTHALPAANKMDYIASTLHEVGYKVHMVSPSWMLNDNHQPFFEKTKTNRILSWKKVTAVSSWKTSTKIGTYFKIVWSLIWLFGYLTINVKRDDKILVYHSPWLALPIIIAKKIKRFQLILEVEEIYGKVWKNREILNKCERKLIESADSYIAVSDVLAEILGPKVKAVVYGNYSLPLANEGEPYFVNDKINLVYAGSIDDTKGGAYKAVETAALLPNQYLVHISGQGDEKSQKKMVDDIEKLNNGLGRVACIFHGIINEEVFTDFLQSCQIALNPQFSGEKFRYLFPSKIIKYMACNLQIVSTAIESIEKSKVSHFINFTAGDQPEDFVKGILSVDLKKQFNSQEKIRLLHIEFLESIKSLLLED